MEKIKILHSESKDYSQKAREILNSFAKVDYLNLDHLKIVNRIGNYHALIVRLKNSVDKEIFRKGIKLKAVASSTTGTNHIDEQTATRHKVRIISLKGETQLLKSVYSTAEHTFGLILSLLRKIPSAHQNVLDGQWQNQQFRGCELYGKTLGIIGFGRLGHMVSKIGKGFGMEILAYDIARKKYPKGIINCSLEKLLASSDIVTLHLPLNKQTRNFMNRSRLRKMKKGAYLINTSRGALLDETGLLALLSKRHLYGAALDVLDYEEKLNFNISTHPLIRYARQHNNLIITPHIGGSAREAIEKTEIFIAKKLKKYFQMNTLL